jgi:hypothetical protein
VRTKKAFDVNGIGFAMQVSGGDDAVEAAIARTALDADEKPAPSAA